MNVFSNYQERVNGRLTVAGFLKRNYGALEKRYGWGKSTAVNYKGVFVNHILDHLKDRPMEEYGPDCVFDIEQAYIEKSAGTKPQNMLDMRNTIRRLIRRTFLLATEKGVVPRGVWTSNSLPPWSTVRLLEAELKKEVARFVDFVILYRMFEEIARDSRNPKATGGRISIETGMRPSEVCGLSYSDCVCENGRHFLLAHNTTGKDAGTRKGYGKTENAPRKEPISKELYDKIMEDFEALQVLADNGKLSKADSKKKHELRSFPVVYKSETQRAVPLKTREFSDYCTELIQNSMHGNVLLNEASAIINESQELLEDLSPEERSPTTYILRHIYYTFLTLCGIPLPVRQTLMGHEITEGGMDANELFESEDFEKAVEIITRCPLLNQSFSVSREMVLTTQHFSQKNLEDITLFLPAKSGTYCIDIEANEPMDAAIIELVSAAGVEGTVTVLMFDTDDPPPKVPNINTDIAKLFQNAADHVRKECVEHSVDRGENSASNQGVDGRQE